MLIVLFVCHEEDITSLFILLLQLSATQPNTQG
jgi:hypothetical protein